ncbi:hypothetical protein LB533_25715 [Mesorhizobium sp. BR1-1-13]|uniref:hypothetical protein n=1 Tax=Mesorhizobium sp. BR1-1-13 TaxID=2876656 RepID=UPI001CD05127|nr:hypothetical protein [Mesorhizobium sp. BR1-1-13]MBZ9944496.1 hypothetical protein [Mesorhizobium sp. BR1-1-13]
MLRFLANNIEQVDLALEHVAKGDANNARFGLMLLDNVVEITLHQIAKDKQNDLSSFLHRDKPYAHAAALKAALGQHFDSKVKFAKKIGKLSEETGNSIGIFHSFRNEVYHIGVQHEAILPAIVPFYFQLSCELLDGYKPPFFGYSHGMTLPERSRKYFGTDRFFSRGIEDYHGACKTLGDSIPFQPAEMAGALADHMDGVIKQQDIAIEVIATGGPRQYTRDEAIVETFAWRIAFSDEGKKYAQANRFRGSLSEFITWLGDNYPFPFRSDPIPGWRTRAARVRAETNPHKALKKYRDFVTQTEESREALDQAHGQVDQYIEEQIERMREDRRR